MAGAFVLLTGVSGVGKTTIALAIAARHPAILVFMGDSLEAPSAAAVASYGPAEGPGGALQRAFALHWMERIAPLLRAGKAVLFESQSRIAFLQEGLMRQGISHARILLVECEDAVRDMRLVQDRKQPELANADMKAWSRYLHDEAVASGCEIIDTGVGQHQEVIARIASYLGCY